MAGLSAPAAEWRELRHADLPSAPHVMRESDEIGAFRTVAAAPLTSALSNEAIAEERAAFTVTVSLDDGRMIVENVIVDPVDGRIVRRLDVEAWKP